MKLTTNLGLKKPDGSDIVDISDLNYNSDVIDNKMATKEELNVVKDEINISSNTKYTTSKGVKEFTCKSGYVDNINIQGQTKILNANNVEVSPGTSGARLVSVGQGDKIEVLTRLYDTDRVTVLREDKKQISTTLRSLPNGVKDEIVQQGDRYYKIIRCGERTLNGEENNIGFNILTNTIQFNFPCTDSLKNSDASKPILISDKFIGKSRNDFNPQDNEGCTVGGTGEIHFKVLRTKISPQTVEGLKTWLQSNPITVVYELATPQIIEIPNPNPRTFADKTTFLLNTGVVQGEASFEVTNSLGSALDVMADKISSLDDEIHENLSEDVQLLNGFVKRFNDDQNNVILSGKLCCLNINTINSSSVSTGTVLCSFGNKFKPKGTVRTYGVSLNDNRAVHLDINNNTVKVQNDFTSNSPIRINVSWEVE